MSSQRGWFSESRSHKHLLTTHRGRFPRPSSMWRGGFRSPLGLFPGPGIARKSVAPPFLLFFVLGGFWSHLLCRVLFFFGLRLSSFFFSVFGSFLKYLDERILNFGSPPGLFTGVEGDWQWRWPGCTWVSAAFLFRPSSRMLYSVGPLSALPVKRSPAKRSCQPQPRGSRREAAPRKDTRQDCRSYVTWRSGSHFNFCTGVVQDKSASVHCDWRCCRLTVHIPCAELGRSCIVTLALAGEVSLKRVSWLLSRS